jgi:hypothetical protein
MTVDRVQMRVVRGVDHTINIRASSYYAVRERIIYIALIPLACT